MNELYAFLKECGPFFLLTQNGDFPAGRPFGALAEYEGDLLFSAGEGKAVYEQLLKCGNVQIVALKPGTREWCRITGTATPCFDAAAKETLRKSSAKLSERFASGDDPKFKVFRLVASKTEKY